MNYIYRLANSVIFKIGVIILLSEVIVLVIVGYNYVNRFSDQVDRRMTSQVQTPGNLMRQELISFNTVEDREIIRGLVGMCRGCCCWPAVRGWSGLKRRHSWRLRASKSMLRRLE